MNEVINPIKAKEFTKKTVCIVKFENPKMDINGPMPGRFFQVTIDPGKLSPDGKFIRFGSNDGDELMGWQPVDWITVESILGEWADDDSKPLLEYKSDAGVTLTLDSA